MEPTFLVDSVNLAESPNKDDNCFPLLSFMASAILSVLAGSQDGSVNNSVLQGARSSVLAGERIIISPRIFELFRVDMRTSPDEIMFMRTARMCLLCHSE